MELREVETFLVLAEKLHFGKAAERLGVTRGRVSQLIRDLEREVGGALFERTSRRVTITPLGEQFRERVKRAHGELLGALHDAQRSARHLRGRLHVGYLPTIGGSFAAQVVAAFEAAHPRCTVVLNAVDSNDTDRVLRNTTTEMVLRNATGENDIVLAWSPGGDGTALATPGLTVGPVLDRVPRAILVPAGHPLACRASVCLDDLVDYVLIRPYEGMTPLICDLWTPRVTPSGRALQYTTDDMATLTGRTDIRTDDLLVLVSRGTGLLCTISTLLDRIPFPGLELVTIEDMPPMATVLLWRTAAEDAMIRAFAQVACSTQISQVR
ncbi:LysR family transcriptional regulator [Nocardia sp. NPDC046473]|uniref:LysR family transcriptional regulator n=1 Tax=Nocardia sp. NPDC046473 TaxID=3155733 RepID=UPI00340FAF02